jgi:pimeloyl-ACP methyl ester carboxylesterase
MTVGGAGSRIARARDTAFSYLEAGSGPSLVLLHGIGSGAASFRCQLEMLSARFRVVAWDAPGYGASTPLAHERPDVSLYAAALNAWLGALDIDRFHLVGQSLGTLIAARFAAEQSRRVLSLTLVGIARGHARLPPSERERLLAQRLDDLDRLEPRGVAAKRGPRLLGPGATEAMRRTVIEIMACIRPEGYAQAAHMLATADITADLARLPAGLPIQVLVGDADLITPPAVNLEIASALPTASLHVIPGAGHALYLEKPEEFNHFVADFAASAIIASSLALC